MIAMTRLQAEALNDLPWGPVVLSITDHMLHASVKFDGKTHFYISAKDGSVVEITELVT